MFHCKMLILNSKEERDVAEGEEGFIGRGSKGNGGGGVELEVWGSYSCESFCGKGHREFLVDIYCRYYIQLFCVSDV